MSTPSSCRMLPRLLLATSLACLSLPAVAQAPGNGPGPMGPPPGGQSGFERPPPPNGQMPPDRRPPPPDASAQGMPRNSANPATGLPPPLPPPQLPVQAQAATNISDNTTTVPTPTAATATAAIPDEADTRLSEARQGNDPEAIGAALLNLADVRMHQSQPRAALPALEEAIALANGSGNDRLGREAAMAMAAAYDMSGDTAMGDTWRGHADEYRERMANRVAPPSPAQAAAPVASAPIAAPPRSAISSAAAAGAQSVSQHWPWWLAVLCLVLSGAWWQSSRRAARLHDETETLARRQRFLQTAHKSLKDQTEQFRQMAVQDSLTGTMNRQAFAGGLDTLLQHAQPFGKPVALFVFDLDHFKTINDRHGHLAGDTALKLVVGVVREKLQSEDLFGRFGGDEFLIGCFGLDRERALQLGETIRAAVVERAKAQVATPMPELSISMGIAHATPGSGYDKEGLFARADTALYAAKRAGRNRVVLEDASLPPPPQDQPTLRSLAPAAHEA